MSFDVKDKFFVKYAPKGNRWEDDDGEETETKLPSDWFATLDEAKAHAKTKAQKDRDGDTYVVFTPVHTVTVVPPDVVTAELN